MSGISGTFYSGDPRTGGTKICTAKTTKSIAPGSCEAVRCDYNNPPAGAIDLWFAADDEGSMMSGGGEVECKEKNNLLHLPNSSCMIIG
jgi:hypothetical protein